MTAKVRVDGKWLGIDVVTSDLSHSSRWLVDSPSGDHEAQITLHVPRDFEAEWLWPNRDFRAFSPGGALLWGGVTGEPNRDGDAVVLNARGIGHTLADFDAVADDPLNPGTELPSFIPNAVVDWAATTYGAKFHRGANDLGNTSLATTGDGPLVSIGVLLARAAALQGKRVHVDSTGLISFRSEPTTPTHTLTPGYGYMGTADDQLVTLLRGYYLKLDSKALFRVRLVGSPTGGTFTLSGNGATTGALGISATAATVQTAVQGLGGAFASALVKVPGGMTMAWDVELPAGGGLLTGDGSALTGGTTPGVSVTQAIGAGIVRAQDADAADKFGPRHARIDLTALGPIEASRAQEFIDGRFALVGGRMGWTEGVDVTPLNLRNLNGAPTSPRWLKAGTMLRIPGVTDSRSSTAVKGSVDIVLSEVRVVEQSRPAAHAAPVGFSPRDYEGALSPPENPAAKESA